MRWSKAVDAAEDPIDKLKAIAGLERAVNVDEAPLREGFVVHAKAWADEQGIRASGHQGSGFP